jgi:hypothetical protein
MDVQGDGLKQGEGGGVRGGVDAYLRAHGPLFLAGLHVLRVTRSSREAGCVSSQRAVSVLRLNREEVAVDGEHAKTRAPDHFFHSLARLSV